MIYEIQNRTQALATLREIASTRPWFYTTVFALDEELDPRDIPMCLARCDTCNQMVDLKMDETPTNECTHCEEGTLEITAVAELLIQGNTVVWREP